MGSKNDEASISGADAALVENLSFSLGRWLYAMLGQDSPLADPTLLWLGHSSRPTPTSQQSPLSSLD